MSRYINADKLIDDLEHDVAVDTEILEYIGLDDIQRDVRQFDRDCKENFIDLLIHNPSIDIVHCGECKWGSDKQTGEAVYCEWHGFPWNVNGFCSYGERKDDETTTV